MVNVELVRIDKSENGVFGELRLNGQLLCVTCEDPDNGNKVGMSCIPEGTYKAVKHNGRLYKDVWRLLDVPNRTAILIHQGNTIEDTEGCILVGKTFGHVNGKPAVLNSRTALNDLRKILPEEFEITIRSI